MAGHAYEIVTEDLLLILKSRTLRSSLQLTSSWSEDWIEMLNVELDSCIIQCQALYHLSWMIMTAVFDLHPHLSSQRLLITFNIFLLPEIGRYSDTNLHFTQIAQAINWFYFTVIHKSKTQIFSFYMYIYIYIIFIFAYKAQINFI